MIRSPRTIIHAFGDCELDGERFELRRSGTPVKLELADDRRTRRRPSGLALYALLVPLALIQTTLRLRWPGLQNLYDDWANVAYYSLFFILGFALARWPAWETVLAREWRRAGVIGLAAPAS